MPYHLKSLQSRIFQQIFGEQVVRKKKHYMRNIAMFTCKNYSHNKRAVLPKIWQVFVSARKGVFSVGFFAPQLAQAFSFMAGQPTPPLNVGPPSEIKVFLAGLDIKGKPIGFHKP